MSLRLVENAETTRDQAIAWVLRLQGEQVAFEDGLAFDAWLEESPSNLEAYEQVLTALAAYDGAEQAVLDGLRREQQKSARILAKRRWTVGAGLGAMAAAVALAVVVLPQGMIIAQSTTYSTARGEHKSVKLADGSSIDMNAETGLSVTLAPHERHVVMGQGEAVFDVAHDKARPFEIEAGDHLVHVVGTQFDVRNRPEGFSVIVARGVVQVRGEGATYVLRKGDRLDLSPGGITKVSTGDPADALGWRTGHMVYRDQPLSRVIADLNRQFPEQVTIADAKLADEKISGVLVMDDQKQVLDRLALMLPLKTVKSEQGVVLHSK